MMLCFFIFYRWLVVTPTTATVYVPSLRLSILFVIFINGLKSVATICFEPMALHLQVIPFKLTYGGYIYLTTDYNLNNSCCFCNFLYGYWNFPHYYLNFPHYYWNFPHYYLNFPHYYWNFPRDYCNFPRDYCNFPRDYCNFPRDYCNFPRDYCNFPRDYCNFPRDYCNFPRGYWNFTRGYWNNPCGYWNLTPYCCNLFNSNYFYFLMY
jgi:hypothetical protein